MNLSQRIVGASALMFVMVGVAAAQGVEPAPPPDGPPPPPEAEPAPVAVMVQPPPVAVIPPPPPPPPSTSTVDLGTLEDANAGRNWLAPTALMDPKGTWSFTDFELFIVGASYAPTDTISLSAATLIPIVKDQPFIGLFSAKVQFLRAGRLRVAAHGAVTLVADDNDGFTSGVIGGAATACIDEHCRSHVTGYLAAGFASADQSAVPFLISGAAVFRVSRRVKVVLEADSAFIAGDINATADGFLAWYGVRFTSPSIGVDVGLVKPIQLDNGSSSDEFPIGFPFVSLTYRGLNEPD